ncbi:hypothetical protein TIFTF001_012567 [Ficus carica]|uniref:KIB1-4 beta-propeller domain-containing protein n=1 Tax=Ficus carica TaxID=3494 RepID=A0AA87ZTJ8_FICCA|nr:hypothetical protein TIFTF001_012567 [Ficus carica]
MTADPLANPDDCILVVLYGSYREMALIRPAKDTAWTKIVVDDTTMPWDMMCQKNDMYVLLQGARDYLNWPDVRANTRVMKQVKVYKLELKGSRWVDIEDLGDDNVLFSGDNSSICMAASNFVGCQPNCIYFTHDYDSVGIGSFGPVDMCVYNLKDKLYTRL